MNSRAVALFWTQMGTKCVNVRTEGLHAPHSSPVSMKDRHTHAQTLLFNGVSQQGRRSLPEGESLGEPNL